jgi:hypothetical protein
MAYDREILLLIEGAYRMNVFGVRAIGGATNTFNDLIGLIYKDHGNSWNMMCYQATTDPGKYWLENPMNVQGTAILQPGQILGAFKTGLHHDEYRALVQNVPFKVWRDNNKDSEYDHFTEDVGMFGINLHHAGQNSIQVDKWSAGCQVIAALNDFNEFMKLIDEHLANGWNDLFHYTLFEEEKI